jgi:hypothetical protein
MNDFKNWLNITEDFVSLPSHANLRKVLELLDEAQIITQDKGIQLPGTDKSANPLVPYGDFKKTDPKTGHTSGFERDQPTLHSYALANPDNMAAVMIFVLLTIHADFRQVMVKTSDFQLITWLDAVGRDPRGRYITFVFQTMLPEGSEATAGSDAKELKWFKQDEIAGQLAFDHEDVLTRWFKGGKHINQLPLVPIILVPTPTGGLTPMR